MSCRLRGRRNHRLGNERSAANPRHNGHFSIAWHEVGAQSRKPPPPAFLKLPAALRKDASDLLNLDCLGADKNNRK